MEPEHSGISYVSEFVVVITTASPGDAPPVPALATDSANIAVVNAAEQVAQRVAEDKVKWNTANTCAIGNIWLCISESIRTLIREKTTAKEIWDELRVEVWKARYFIGFL